jgi:hypothetical protein
MLAFLAKHAMHIRWRPGDKHGNRLIFGARRILPGFSCRGRIGSWFEANKNWKEWTAARKEFVQVITA